MITFKPAVREQTPLIIGLAGPSKAGKTTSAIRLALGMSNGAPVLMVNTEGARGHINADRYQYQVFDLVEPFSPERYREAIEAAAALKPGALIIDSGSHMHEGIGGVLDMHEKELDRMAGEDFKKRERMTWAAWVKPKAAEAQMINAMLRANCHIILCLRAKEKLKIVRGKEPEPMGWQPICTDRMTFETTVTLILPPGSQGKPDLSAQGSELRDPLDKMIPDGKQIDEALGKRLAEWAAGKTKGGEASGLHMRNGDTLSSTSTVQHVAGGASGNGGAPMTYESMLKAADSLATLQDVWRTVWKETVDPERTRLELVKNERKQELMEGAAA